MYMQCDLIIISSNESYLYANISTKKKMKEKEVNTACKNG